jgi:hypothetical protein
MKNIAKPLTCNYIGVLTIYYMFEKRKTTNNILELSIPKLIEDVSKINEDVVKVKDLLNKLVYMKINCVDTIEKEDVDRIVEFSREQLTKIKLIIEDKKVI